LLKFVNNSRLNVFFIFAIYSLLIFTACSENRINDSTNSILKTVAGNTMKIIWQPQKKMKDKTVIPGSSKADFGKFEFRWIINPDGKARLVTMEPAGSAELPLIEKRIMPLVLPDGSTLLFQDWLPLLNEKKTSSIRLITRVSTSELFSVFPVVKVPPSSAIGKTVNQVLWGIVCVKNDVKYLPGSTKVPSGSLNILWKKRGAGIPELVTEESPGAGELPAVERKLLIWIDETSGITYICKEQFPLLDQGYCSYLQCLTAVKTDELLKGFAAIIGTVSEK